MVDHGLSSENERIFRVVVREIHAAQRLHRTVIPRLRGRLAAQTVRARLAEVLDGHDD